jgi:hypothetical protein
MDDVGIFYGHFVFLRPFGIFYSQLVHFVVIWYIFSQFGTLHQGKSGNPARKQQVFREKIWRKKTCSFFWPFQLLLVAQSGLPDFSWYMIPKLEKNVTNEHKM